jgi:hypothetical protein
MVGDSLWAIVVVLGFVVLGGAIAFAKLKNKTTPEQERRTEQATKDLYREQSAEDRTRTP